MTEADIDAIAKKIYDRSTANDPIVHCNRFPTWDELTEGAKQVYRQQVTLLNG